MDCRSRPCFNRAVFHGTVVLNADGALVYTPTANYSGTESFTYLANDGKLSSNIATVTITVDPVAVTPIAGNASFTLLENKSLTVAAPGLLLYSQNPNGDSLTVNVVNGPLYDSSFSAGNDGSVSYTPVTNFSGSDTFTYFLSSDGLNSNIATVTLNVVPVPLAPIAVNDAYSLNENSTLNVSAPAFSRMTSTPTDCRFRRVFKRGHPMASSALSSDGTFIYTPNTNYFGTDSFTYIANDGKLSSNVATVTLTVTEAELAPTIPNQSFSAIQNQVLVVPSPGVLGSTDRSQQPAADRRAG